MKRLMAVLLLMCGMAAAQCPITVEHVVVHDISRGREVNLKAKWKNTSDKTIIGVKFQVLYFDPTKDAHDPHETFSSDQKTKPGDSKTTYWRNYLWSQVYQYHEADIWPTKVVFDDGSVWRDDGSKQCVAHGSL
jgi:hypothetical protein